MVRPAVLTAFAMLAGLTLATLGLNSMACAYDATWFRAESWGGEYPNGFTLESDQSIRIRDAPEIEAPRSVECILTRGATFHPWNTERVERDHLSFLTFTKTEDYRVKQEVKAHLFRAHDSRSFDIEFKREDRWRFLYYIGEGVFLMQFEGHEYQADLDLIQASEIDDPSPQVTVSKSEWLQLTCANNARGWLLLDDVKGLAGFGPPNLGDYGEARDR